ncbi:MAG TPA: LON peptidase substrate-binding domain-containing protein [Caulobacteraceae bacterium]|nr:LON peptidase substrate-binding domain-containing protein [Caulobacteraceae bacterium]
MAKREDAVASSGDLPQVLPVFPLAGAILLPHASRPFNIFEPRYLNMIDDAMAAERIIGLVQPAMGMAANPPERPFLAQVGCAGRITAFTETSDGRYLITLTGVSRFRLGEELPAATPYRRVRADFDAFAADLQPLPGVEDDRETLLGPLRRYLEPRDLTIEWDLAENAPIGPLINSLAMALPFDPAEQQALLEAPTPDERRRMLIALLRIDGPFGDDPPSLQ